MYKNCIASGPTHLCGNVVFELTSEEIVRSKITDDSFLEEPVVFSRVSITLFYCKFNS